MIRKITSLFLISISINIGCSRDDAKVRIAIQKPQYEAISFKIPFLSEYDWLNNDHIIGVNSGKLLQIIDIKNKKIIGLEQQFGTEFQNIFTQANRIRIQVSPCKKQIYIETNEGSVKRRGVYLIDSKKFIDLNGFLPDKKVFWSLDSSILAQVRYSSNNIEIIGIHLNGLKEESHLFPSGVTGIVYFNVLKSPLGYLESDSSRSFEIRSFSEEEWLKTASIDLGAPFETESITHNEARNAILFTGRERIKKGFEIKKKFPFLIRKEKLGRRRFFLFQETSKEALEFIGPWNEDAFSFKFVPGGKQISFLWQNKLHLYSINID